MQLEARFVSGVEAVSAADWDRLVGPDGSPFLEWGFLRACELGSTLPEHGVLPQHLTQWDEGRLVGALPLFLKGDGRGEFIYDWAWSQLAHRLGAEYYPKAISMAPFTPVTGTHLLLAPGYERAEVWPSVAALTERWAAETGLTGIHHLFLPDDEAELLEGLGYLRRLSFQLAWTNAGYADLEAFLARFRSKDRVRTKRELRGPSEAGLEVEVLEGEQLGARERDAMHGFYERTCLLHGTGSDYLKRPTWEAMFEAWRARLVLFAARADGELVGGALCVRKGRELYGRYWGATRDVPFLYFNLAFYAPIRWCIERGVARFWVGFGNSYAKFARGLEPVPTHSAHHVRDPRLAATLARVLASERERVAAEVAAVTAASKLKPLA